MEPNENHHQQHYFSTTSTTVTATPSPTNGLLPRNESGEAHHMLYPHSVPSAVTSPLEPARRKRGRPRKYGTPEQAMAAKKTASLSSKERREQQQSTLGGAGGSLSGSFKKSQLVGLGNAGQSFTLHVINVVAGEDVGQKIMMFMQQSKHEICILSASGTISNASLRQPATSGGNIAYEGRFDIISLSGSYVRTEIGGRTGGLSACLSSADGQIIGGGVGGPLKAAGPVQVIVATFMIDNKKDTSAGAKGDATGSKLPSPVGGASVSNVGSHSAFENPGRNPTGGNDDHQNFGRSHFMMQSQGMQPTDWRTGLDGRIGFELTG
ncbi:hypothetical protein V6N13_031367 [Hibiscus sabdariffa]|uniref:AT-hook motif nuclear-localized protein n=1 Tax=Hibiscus sabdariffa TaxID=183260 RepID=A0ABR2CKJ4_9ROSI